MGSLRGTSLVPWKGRIYSNFNIVNLTPLRITDFDVQAIDAK